MEDPTSYALIPASSRPLPAPVGFGARDRLYRRGGKRVFDIAFVLLSAPLVLPAIALLALLAALDGHWPFFGHQRVGLNGRFFRCWKIRTMVPDAPSRLARHLEADPAARAEWEAGFKLERDPRITRIGHFLRRSSLDELPQVWNILIGEMSVVGPRPVIEQELRLYRSALRHYYALRPGLTGLWQVSGRNQVSYGERVALDVLYARNHSLRMDVPIIFATMLAVVNRTGR